MLGRLRELAQTALLRHGTEPRALVVLALLSVFDGFVPMLPAEVFVLVLGILQPQRGKRIVLVFAVASALSALLLALLLETLGTPAEWPGPHMGAQWDQALTTLRAWGPATMVLLAVFPDTPRTSIAVLALSGVLPASMVFAGKLVLYASLLALMHDLPSRLGRWRSADAAWQRWLQRRASRFVAYGRRIRWLARRPGQGFSPSQEVF
jgi:hypothetical protein